MGPSTYVGTRVRGVVASCRVLRGRVLPVLSGWGRLAARGVALAALLAGATQAQERILTIVESDSRLPLAREVLNGMEEVFGTTFMAGADFYVEYLDMFRFSSPAQIDPLRDLMVARYAGTPPRVVVALGPNALRFAIDNRAEIAPRAPIVFAVISPEQFAAIPDAPDVTGTLSDFAVRATVALARGLQPGARTLVVITGAGAYDRQWETAARKVFGDRFDGLEVRYLSALPIGETLAALGALESDTIALVLSYFVDGNGRRFNPRNSVRQFSEVSGAPLYGVYDTYLGHGIVGGVFGDSRETGRVTARIVQDMLNGVPIPLPGRLPVAPAVDARQLDRWSLSYGNLPENAAVAFREPGAWERYRTAIIVIGAIIAAQAATIALLSAERARTRRVNETLALERQQLVHVSRNMRLGQLSAALAHEINQPLAAILANAEAGSRLIARDPPDLGEIADILADIAADDRRAAAIIADLRRLIVRNETRLEPLDLNAIVRGTLELMRNEIASRGARVETDLAPGTLQVRGNASQLQQIVLNITCNAAEAMEAVPPNDRVITIVSRRVPGRGIVLSVADRGAGVPPDRREELFRPFVTSKPAGLGVGLAICRNIAEAHGGTLAFVDAAQPGARIELTLPGAG